MLIYCCRIALVPSENEDSLLATIGDWLEGKTEVTFSADDLRGDGERRILDRSTVEWLSAENEGERWRALRYVHPDRATAGREWLADVGIWKNRDTFISSVMLHTREQSALVNRFIQTTRPNLVADIFQRCRVSSDTSGGTARPLRLLDAEAFLYEVSNPERTHPIVQISCTRDGEYLILPERAASLLAGVATVAVIPMDVDTFALEDALGGQYCCYHGAVNVIWPLVKSGGNGFATFQRIMAHDIAAVRERGESPESRLLATVCHRMNEVYARDHISPEMVRAVKHRAALDEVRRSAPKLDPELEELVRLVDEDQKGEITRLREDLKGRDDELASARNEISEMQRENESLKYSLASAGRAMVPSGPLLAEEARRVMIAAASEDFTLPDALGVLAALYPDRLVILESARKSAKDAANFKYPRKAFELLNTLCTNYWKALADGKGDVEAHRAFPQKSFAAHESETVRKNKRACSLRTFPCNGQSVEMMKHLKIGASSEGSANTWRAHFEWDAQGRKIVLGHCGKHLDHK